MKVSNTVTVNIARQISVGEILAVNNNNSSWHVESSAGNNSM